MSNQKNKPNACSKRRVSDAKRLFERGYTAEQVSEMIPISMSSVYNLSKIKGWRRGSKMIKGACDIKSRLYTGHQIEESVNLWRLGWSLKSIEGRTGVNYMTVRHWAREMMAERDRPAYNSGQFKSLHPRYDVQRSMAMWVAAYTDREIEMTTGISIKRVREHAHRRRLKRGNVPGVKVRCCTQKAMDNALGFVSAGYTMDDAARFMGIKASSVGSAMDRVGMKSSRRGLSEKLQDPHLAAMLVDYATGVKIDVIAERYGKKKVSVNNLGAKVLRPKKDGGVQMAMRVYEELASKYKIGSWALHGILVAYGVSETDADVLVERRYSGLHGYGRGILPSCTAENINMD